MSHYLLLIPNVPQIPIQPLNQPHPAKSSFSCLGKSHNLACLGRGHTWFFCVLGPNTWQFCFTRRCFSKISHFTHFNGFIGPKWLFSAWKLRVDKQNMGSMSIQTYALYWPHESETGKLGTKRNHKSQHARSNGCRQAHVRNWIGSPGKIGGAGSVVEMPMLVYWNSGLFSEKYEENQTVWTEGNVWSAGNLLYT